jgi:hypothetical protein
VPDGQPRGPNRFPIRQPAAATARHSAAVRGVRIIGFALTRLCPKRGQPARHSETGSAAPNWHGGPSRFTVLASSAPETSTCETGQPHKSYYMQSRPKKRFPPVDPPFWGPRRPGSLYITASCSFRPAAARSHRLRRPPLRARAGSQCARAQASAMPAFRRAAKIEILAGPANPRKKTPTHPNARPLHPQGAARGILLSFPVTQGDDRCCECQPANQLDRNETRRRLFPIPFIGPLVRERGEGAHGQHHFVRARGRRDGDV